MSRRKQVSQTWSAEEWLTLLEDVRERIEVTDEQLTASQFGRYDLRVHLEDLSAVASTAQLAFGVFEASCEPWRASSEVLNRFAQLFAGFLDLLDAIDDYDPQSATSSSNRGGDPGAAFWSNPGNGIVKNFWNDYSDVAPFINQKSGDEKSTEDAQQKYNDLAALTAIELHKAEQARDRLEKIEAAAREATGKIAAGSYVKRYEDEVEAQEKRATAWWWGIVVSGVALAAMVLWGIDARSVDGEGNEITLDAVEWGSQALRLALPASALVFSIRQFSAARHNALVFKNKALALGTYPSFVEASSDETTRSAVVIEAAKAVFSQQPTGYLKGGSGTPEATSTNIVTEVIKGGE